MPFDWERLLGLADELVKQASNSSNPEAHLRSAVSRAYFAAFCHVRNYASSFLAFTPRGDGEDHGRLRAHLARGKRRAFAGRLDQLRQLRNAADYSNDLPWSNHPVAVQNAIDTARNIFRSFQPPATT